MKHPGERRMIRVTAKIAQEFVHRILKKALDKSATGIVHERNIKAEGPLFKKMPILRQPFEAVKSIEPGFGMMIRLYPPGKRGTTRHPKLQVLNRLPIQSQLTYDVFMQLNPVGLAPERLIKVGKRQLPAISVDPGGKKGEIIKEPEEKSEGDEQDPYSGNEKEVFYKGIGLSNKTSHNR